MEPLLDIDRFFTQLDEDIDIALLIKPLPDQLTARKILYTHRLSQASVAPWCVIRALQGLRVIDDLDLTFSTPVMSGFDVLLGTLDAKSC